MREWFDSLAPRERLFVLIGATAVVVLLVWGLLLVPLFGAADAAATRVESKRALLQFLQQAGAEIRAAGGASGAPAEIASGESLVVVVDRSARQAGLGNSLTRNQPMGEDGIRVRLEDAAFDSLARWLGELHRSSGLAIESASFDRGQNPGRVNASLVLRQSLQ